MLRKRIIALLAAAAVGMLAPGVAFAGHGGHGGSSGGGGRGGSWGGGGGWSGGGALARSGGSAIGTNRAAFASSNVSGGDVRGQGWRGDSLRREGRGERGEGRGDRFRRGDRDRDFRFGAFAFGFGYPYDYYDYPYYDDYAYNDTYYDDGGCYVVRRRVSTPYGWRIRPVQVCG
jgi:hypothetical protein